MAGFRIRYSHVGISDMASYLASAATKKERKGDKDSRIFFCLTNRQSFVNLIHPIPFVYRLLLLACTIAVKPHTP